MTIKRNLNNILYWSLGLICRLTITRFKPKIIAVTGSAGKTSAKEAIWTILNKNNKVRKSAKNFNNELGVSLAVIGNYNKIWHPVILFWFFVMLKGVLNLFMPKTFYPKILILEYGADRPGDITRLIEIAKPDISVITSIGEIPVHIEFYPSGAPSIIKEKSKIISNLSVSNVAVLNFDDNSTFGIKDKTRARVVGFGFSEKADIRISNFSHIISNKKILGVNFKIENSGSMLPVVIKDVFSIGYAYASASAIAVAREVGFNIIESADILSKSYIPTKGRSLIIDGIKNSQIIDESYNSSPIALEFALLTMSGIDFRRRVGVLGDMLELGEFTQKAHEKIGKTVSDSLNVLITVGIRAKFIANMALRKGMNKDNVYVYETAKEAISNIKNIIKEDDLILVKGSRAIGLEKIVSEIKETRVCVSS